MKEILLPIAVIIGYVTVASIAAVVIKRVWVPHHRRPTADERFEVVVMALVWPLAVFAWAFYMLIVWPIRKAADL